MRTEEWISQNSNYMKNRFGHLNNRYIKDCQRLDQHNENGSIQRFIIANNTDTACINLPI